MADLILGSLTGVFAVVTYNGVRKRPLFRNPWNHLIAIGLGAYALRQWSHAEADMIDELSRFYDYRKSALQRAIDADRYRPVADEKARREHRASRAELLDEE
eukprot:Rmarinus@m.4849